MSIAVQDLVESGVYPSADIAVNEALRVLWQERPAVRIDVAVRGIGEDARVNKIEGFRNAQRLDRRGEAQLPA